MFRWVNGWPDAVVYVLWLPMQLGNLVVGVLWGLGTAWAVGRRDIAIAAIVAAPVKLVAERVVRHRLGDDLAVRRQRPATSMPGAHLHGGSSGVRTELPIGPRRDGGDHRCGDRGRHMAHVELGARCWPSPRSSSARLSQHATHWTSCAAWESAWWRADCSA